MRFLPSKIISFILVLLIVCVLLNAIAHADFYEYLESAKVVPEGFQASYATVARNLFIYQLHWDELKKDKSFITYEMVQRLGAFDYFACSDLYPGKIERMGVGAYNYFFRDKNNSAYRLNVSSPTLCTSKLKHIDAVTDYIDLTDLRACKKPIDGVFTIHDVCFTYNDGILRSLRWNTATHTFYIDLNSDVSSYKLGSNTFLGQILNGRTMPAAIMNFNLTVQLGTFIRQTGILRAILDGLLAVLFLAWGILQKKNMSKFCKNALQIVDEDTRKRYLKDCGTLKLLLAWVFAVMALVEYCEPVFYSLFLLLYAILLGLVWWQQRLINKEAFAEITDPAAQCASE